jgi:hypothetical protein
MSSSEAHAAGHEAALVQSRRQSESFAAVHPEAQHPSPPVHAVIATFVHSAVHIEAAPETRSIVQASPSSHAVGHDDGGSQVSPGSTRPSPQLAMQSSSSLLVHPLGQHPSPSRQAVTSVLRHIALHIAALPMRESLVQASPSSQLVGHDPGGSQVSPGSSIPSPQDDEQSESLAASHPLGQQPSPEAQSVIVVWRHYALQLLALPVTRSAVHAMPSSQLVGQDPGGSHVSSGSRTPSPQDIEQSGSVSASHPSAQH